MNSLPAVIGRRGAYVLVVRPGLGERTRRKDLLSKACDESVGHAQLRCIGNVLPMRCLLQDLFLRLKHPMKYMKSVP